MKKLFLILPVLFFLLSSTAFSSTAATGNGYFELNYKSELSVGPRKKGSKRNKTVHVKSYVRKNGTKVHSHNRKHPR